MRSIALALSATLSLANAEAPIGKVLSMVSDLQSSIIKEGEVAQKEYAEYAEWCEERASNLAYEIKTGKAEVADLKASIAEQIATSQSLTAKVDKLAASIAANEADLDAATKVRAKEEADFLAEEKELSETADMLRRASGIIEREMQKGGASMMQIKNAGGLLQALSVMVQASIISSADHAKLSAFIQSTQEAKDSDDDDAIGAPAAATYQSHSGDILDVLNDLLEKAEDQLAQIRKTETTSKNNFELLKQSLEDELRFANKEMAEAKSGISASSEKKSTDEGNLGATQKELAADEGAKRDLHHNCMTKAETFEAETKSRGEELKALAEAKKIIKEATGTALSQVSLLQTSRSQLSSGADLARFEVARLIRDLARAQHSTALAQLASRVSSAAQLKDPFVKIKGLIADMIDKLESQAGADATEKAFCDKELAESNAKKEDKTDEIQKMTTKFDQDQSTSAQLKEETAALQNELAKLAKSQAEMDKLRQEEKAAFDETSAELNKGLDGIKLALKVLTEYYASEDKAHNAAEGAGSGIIALLEVCEADFSKNLAEVTADEERAVADYESGTKDNEIEQTTKEQDVKYKTEESTYLDKSSSDLSADRSGVQEELDAVLEYLTKMEKRCIAKAETYESRKARHEAEIAGLKEALKILETEVALVQKSSKRTLRGTTRHM